MEQEILVECLCITSTAADYDYYQAGTKYTIDMVWAKKRDVWRYFKPLREVSVKEVKEKYQDESPMPRTENAEYNKRVRKARTPRVVAAK